MVYIDMLTTHRQFPRARMLRCHLVADTLQELHDFAKKLGIPRDAFHVPPRHRFPHYKLNEHKREEAIALGAEFVSIKKIEEVANDCGFVMMG